MGQFHLRLSPFLQHRHYIPRPSDLSTQQNAHYSACRTATYQRIHVALQKPGLSSMQCARHTSGQGLQSTPLEHQTVYIYIYYIADAFLIQLLQCNNLRALKRSLRNRSSLQCCCMHRRERFRINPSARTAGTQFYVHTERKRGSCER